MAYKSDGRYSTREERRKMIEKRNRIFKTKVCVGSVLLFFFVLLIIYLALFSPFGKKKNDKNKAGDTVPTTKITTVDTTADTTTTEPTTATTTSSTTTIASTHNTTHSTTKSTTQTTTATPADATPIDKVYDDGIRAQFNAAETNQWYLKLIGPYSDPLPKNYKPSLTSIEGQTIHSSIVKSYKAMKEAARKDGVNIYIISGYRSYQRQKNNFNNRYNLYKSQGYSDKEAYAKTAAIIAKPGTSEHHLGLAMDLNSLDQSFGNTKEGKWLAKNAYKYGFILRYEADTTDITGIVYEPWHFRYVSVEHAYRIKSMGVTLEEYIEWLNSLG